MQLNEPAAEDEGGAIALVNLIGLWIGAKVPDNVVVAAYTAAAPFCIPKLNIPTDAATVRELEALHTRLTTEMEAARKAKRRRKRPAA